MRVSVEDGGWLRPSQAAVMLGVTTTTVRAWFYAGHLDGYQLGRTIRLTRASLEAVLNEGAGSQTRIRGDR